MVDRPHLEVNPVAHTKAPIAPSSSAVYFGTSHFQPLALDRARSFRNRFSSNDHSASCLGPKSCLAETSLALRLTVLTTERLPQSRIKGINIFAVNEPLQMSNNLSQTISGFERIKCRSCLPEAWRDPSGIARCSLGKMTVAL